MEQQYKSFVTTLYTFVSDINRYVPNDGCKIILEVFNKLEMPKIIMRFYSLMFENQNKIELKDVSLFNDELNILPGFNLSSIWPKLTSAQKGKVWVYLKMLYVNSETIILFHKMNKDKDTNKKEKETNKEKGEEDIPEFNPYVGITGGNNNYGVNDVCATLDSVPEQNTSGPGIESIMTTLGLDKMLNMDEINEQFKNMNPEDIKQATSTIQSLLGKDLDEKTTKFVSGMISSITDEIQKGDLKNGNIFTAIPKIAESVAEQMKPTVEKEGIDMQKLFNSTKNIAENCTDENGNKIFNENMNPFSMLGPLMNSQGMTQEQYMQQCDSTLKNIGMNNVNMQQMMAMMQGQGGMQQMMAMMQNMNMNQRNTKGKILKK